MLVLLLFLLPFVPLDGEYNSFSLSLRRYCCCSSSLSLPSFLFFFFSFFCVIRFFCFPVRIFYMSVSVFVLFSLLVLLGCVNIHLSVLVSRFFSRFLISTLLCFCFFFKVFFRILFLFLFFVGGGGGGFSFSLFC